MAHMMKKAEFLAVISNWNEVSFRTFRGSVYIRNGEKNTESEIEIYRASNMEESGIICSMNQRNKYHNWMLGAKS